MTKNKNETSSKPPTSTPEAPADSGVAITREAVKIEDFQLPAGFTQVNLDIDLGHCGSPYLVVPPGRENTPADQSPVLNQAFSAAHDSILEAFGMPPVYLREGGSVPIIADLKRVAGLDSLMIGMFTTQDNLHAPDESVHIGMLEKGVEASSGILANLAGVNAD